MTITYMLTIFILILSAMYFMLRTMTVTVRQYYIQPLFSFRTRGGGRGATGSRLEEPVANANGSVFDHVPVIC
jgi:hypothetical protein